MTKEVNQMLMEEVPKEELKAFSAYFKRDKSLVPDGWPK
jgi:hypothetical protein